jgi:hypothetical protein
MATSDSDPQAASTAETTAERKRSMLQLPKFRAAIEECARITAQALEFGLLSRRAVERLREALREHDQAEGGTPD